MPKENRTTANLKAAFLLSALTFSSSGQAQSRDWQSVVYREPQVRYLLTDMTLSGRTELYEKYAVEEMDPDSREAIRLWGAGVRVINTNEFERRWITNGVHTTKPYLRIVLRGSNRTITGDEVLLTSDGHFRQSEMRCILAELSLGQPISSYVSRKDDLAVAEALLRWTVGARVLNTNWFQVHEEGSKRYVVYRGTATAIDGAHIKLNSDLAYPETNVRYFLADISLGGSIEFYRRVAEEAHEMGCLEAVTRWDNGIRVTNLEQFERKRLKGKVVITRRDAETRISGMEVTLSSD